jgi:hypothetical protein
MQKVDRATVKAFELTAPGACRADFQALYGKVRSGQILGAFSERDREDIWSRVLSATVDRLVPSLFSFFEDLNYLKNVADGVKRLFPLSPRGTVSSAIDDAFSDANHRAGQCVVQESESSCVFRPGSLADRVDLGRRQIWMFAMRDYPQMPAEPKKKNLLTKPASEKADEIVLCEFAALASRLGYESERIRSLAQRSPDREIARSALLKARKPARYKYSEAAFEDYVEQIVNLFSAAQPVTVEQARAAVEIDYSDILPKRCGIPRTQDHERDKLSLFVDRLHNTDEEQCDEMSSFFIRRSVYFAFFGKPSRPIPRSEEVSLLDTPISAPLGDDQVREEQERLVRQEQERLAREEQERLAREEQARLAQEEQERQERLAREEQERLAKEERERQVQLAREEQERSARAEQERLAREQESLAREEQERLAREEQERLAREEQERLAREEQERLVREEQERLASEQERLAREEQERLARVEQERLAREEQERLVREEQERQERAALEEQERLARGEQERLEREEQERLAREEQERLAREEQERQERAAREEQERLIREEQERLAREEQERLAREEQGRLAREEQERLAREEQERLAKEEQERLAREEQERLAKEQERLAKEEQERLAREEQERLAREEQERLAREEQERLAREEQDRLAREEQERLANKEQEGLAKEEQDRAEQERLAREEQERVTREEQERLVENLAKQWEDRPKQKKPDKTQQDKGPKVPRSQNGVRRGLRASASAKRRERPLTQLDLKKVTNGESSEANYRFVPPSQAFNFSLEAAGDQVEVDNASHPPQPSSDSSAADNSTASGKPPQLASDSREQNQAVERPAREKQGKLTMEEEERLVREEQERVAHEELEKAAREEEETPTTEGKGRLVKNIAKQWEERLGQKLPKEKTQDQGRPKAVGKGARRGIGAAKRNRPLTQFALETLRDAESQELTQEGRSPQPTANERPTTADQEVVGNPTHSTQPATDSSATNNSNSISASSKIPDHVTNSEEQIQAVEPQVRA